MSADWYYVDPQKNERVGPLTKSELENKFSNGELISETYVWTKGFDDWTPAAKVEGLRTNEPQAQQSVQIQDEVEDDAPTSPSINLAQQESFQDSLQNEKKKSAQRKTLSPKDVDWSSVPRDKRIVHLMVGLDRGMTRGTEFGPFSWNEVGILHKQRRINTKTYFYIPGLDNWYELGNLPIFEEVFGIARPDLDETNRRVHSRKPFVARLFFSDSENVYEGVCRDISIGGMQVMMSGFSGNIGDSINLNVHPDNTEHSFVASGQIVRFLQGNMGFSFRFDNLSEAAKDSIKKYLNAD